MAELLTETFISAPICPPGQARTGYPSLPYGAAPNGHEHRLLIGEIFIAGNDRTPNSVILKVADLYPGEPLSYPRLRLAEKRLADSGLFVVDEKKGVRPTINVTASITDTRYQNIQIAVKEIPPALEWDPRVPPPAPWSPDVRHHNAKEQTPAPPHGTEELPAPRHRRAGFAWTSDLEFGWCIDMQRPR
jgi:hypothetical protein